MIMLNWIMNILFMKIPALRQWLGKTIKQINIRAAFHIYIIGIKKDNKTEEKKTERLQWQQKIRGKLM